MNPQLEQYLEDFEGLESDEDVLGLADSNSVRAEPIDLHDVDVDNSNISSTSPIINEDEGHVIFVRNIMKDKTFIGCLVLMLAVNLAGWMQLLQFHLQVRIGTTANLSFPGVYVFLGMTVIYILVKEEPRKQPSQPHASDAKKQPLLHKDDPSLTPRKSNPVNEERKKRQHDCRCELSSVLGSIGAPLLRPNDTTSTVTDDNYYNMMDDQWYSTVAKLAMAHAELMRTIDTSMEILKMGTALNLGATESTAERVERALFGRRQRQVQNQNQQPNAEAETLSIAMPVSFGSIRNLVTEAMLGQVGSLLNFANTTSLDPTKESDDPTMVTSLGPDDVLGGVPSVITLGWIRSSRQQVAAILSYVLDELIHASRDGGVSIDHLEHSIQVAEELRLHVLHAIGLGDNGQDSKDNADVEASVTNPNSDSSTLLKSQLSKLQTQYRKLFIALWAMEDSITEGTGETVEEDKPAVCETTKDWWVQVNTLNDDAVASLQNLENALFQEQVPGAANEEEQESKMDLLSSTKSNTVQSYTVETNSLLPEVQNIASTKATKTAVFSGKGVVEPQSRSRKKPASNPPSTTGQQSSSSAANLQKDPVAQHFLLGELRTRLQTLSLPEEQHEVIDDDYDDVLKVSRPSTERRHVPVKKTTSIPLFGGSTGSLLVGELSNAVKQLGGQSSIGDDDDDDDDDDEPQSSFNSETN